MKPVKPELALGPVARYDLSGARVARMSGTFGNP